MDRPSRDNPLVADHRRQWRRCRYVYPVISRRSKGLSIGVNLNPDKRCTFACLYCQINRGYDRGLRHVDLEALRGELGEALAAAGGDLWAEPRFARTPPELRRVRDIAFSGDGEPTCAEEFDRAVAIAAEQKHAAGLDGVKLVVITNASQLDGGPFQRALPLLDRHGGEIWAKLDAGTETFFQRINRPAGELTLRQVVGKIASVARARPVVIQSLWSRLESKPPREAELAAYVRRLKEILLAGGRIKLIQLHTVARPPADASVAALSDEQLDALAQRVRSALPEVPVETYYGRDVPPQGG